MCPTVYNAYYLYTEEIDRLFCPPPSSILLLPICFLQGKLWPGGGIRANKDGCPTLATLVFPSRTLFFKSSKFVASKYAERNERNSSTPSFFLSPSQRGILIFSLPVFRSEKLSRRKKENRGRRKMMRAVYSGGRVEWSVGRAEERTIFPPFCSLGLRCP